MPARNKILTSIATVVALLCLALPAAAATWTTEPVPAGPGALGPARLSFDAQGRALFLWDGVPTASQSTCVPGRPHTSRSRAAARVASKARSPSSARSNPSRACVHPPRQTAPGG